MLDLVTEREELQKAVGEKWIGWWMLTGNQQLDDLYRRAGKERPLDLVFGNRDYARQIWNESVIDITRSTGQSIGFFCERNLKMDYSQERLQRIFFKMIKVVSLH